MSLPRRARFPALLLCLSAAACAPPPAPAVSPPPPPAEPAEPVPPPAVAPAAPEAPRPAPPAPPPEPPPDPALMADIATDPAPALEPAVVPVRATAWLKARKALTAAVRGLAPDAPLDTHLVAHALLARSCAALKDDACVTAEAAAASTLWATALADRKRLDAPGDDERTQRRRLARSVAAVGELLFLAAEQQRAIADHVTRPVYRGKGNQDEVLTFVKTKVAAWIAAKRPALDTAERAYVKVLQIQPVPPPRWVIASGERVGAMWAGFVDDFRAAPMPAAWAGEGAVPGANGLTYKELREAYLTQIDEAVAPQLDRARAAYESCHDLAARFHVSDDRSHACDAWLSAHPVTTRAAPGSPAPPRKP